MKAVISTTYDDKYLFFLPIVTWCWNKLGVDVICFVPFRSSYSRRMNLIFAVQKEVGLRFANHVFGCSEHKEATYAQCSRLYAAALDLPDDEILITSDIDMAVLKVPYNVGWNMAVTGSDLVPDGQLPICYITGPVKEWRRRFEINGRTYQEKLDSLLGEIECENMRGNYWAKDQEEAKNKIVGGTEHAYLIQRARPGTQFATNRLDRDDAFLLDRLSPDIIDYHMPRPGYETAAFHQIMIVLQHFYPNDDFQWLFNYRNEYLKIL